MTLDALLSHADELHAINGKIEAKVRTCLGASAYIDEERANLIIEMLQEAKFDLRLESESGTISLNIVNAFGSR